MSLKQLLTDLSKDTRPCPPPTGLASLERAVIEAAIESVRQARLHRAKRCSFGDMVGAELMLTLAVEQLLDARDELAAPVTVVRATPSNDTGDVP
jgi:hypothetical protein